MIYLEEIAFNHDPTSATTDAINLRRNATDWVHVPEWRRGISITAEDSPAAYSIGQVAGHTVTIKASLSCTDPNVVTAEVRAVGYAGHGELGFIEKLRRPLARCGRRCALRRGHFRRFERQVNSLRFLRCNYTGGDRGRPISGRFRA